MPRSLTVFLFISFLLKFAEGYHLQLIKFLFFKKFITLPPPAKKLQVALPWGLNGLASNVFVLIILIKKFSSEKLAPAVWLATHFLHWSFALVLKLTLDLIKYITTGTQSGRHLSGNLVSPYSIDFLAREPFIA